MYWKVLQYALSFFINLFLARHFKSTISAGFYSFVYLLSLLATFFTLGLDIGLNYYLSRRELSSGTACRIIAVVTILALVISLPLLALSFHPPAHPHLSREQWLMFAAFHIAGTLLTNLSGSIFAAYGRSYQASRYAFLLNLLLAVLTFSTPSFFDGPRMVENLFLLYFTFSFLQGVILYLIAAAGYLSLEGGEELREKVRPRTILRFAFFVFVTNFIFFLSARLGVYLLPYWVKVSDLGNYIQAYKLMEYPGLVAAFLYYPFIALVAGRQEEKRKEKILLLLVRISHTAILLFSIGMILCGRTLLPFMYGHSFDGMYGIFLCFIPGIFPVCSSSFFTAYFYGAGWVKYNLVSGCILLLSGVLLFIPLTGAAGVRGAALAFSLANLASMAYDCIVFRKNTPYKLGDILLVRTDDLRVIRTYIRNSILYFVSR